MADASRIVRQWLETEEALGMEDVPVATGRQQSDVKYAVRKEPEAPVARAVVRAARGSPPVPEGVPVKPVEARQPVRSAAVAARPPMPEKKNPALPAVIPAGKIADFPK